MYAKVLIFSRNFFVYVVVGAIFTCAFFAFMGASQPAQAATGINKQINFQGRLLNAQGATVPDGYYNIQFKIYQDGDGCVSSGSAPCSGTLKWTESYLNNSSQGVMVKNGFLSVNLGSITAFSTSIDWNQDTLWLSMNIGTTNPTCTPFSSCSPDGEMVPFKRLSSTPYALNSGQLGGLTSQQFVQLAQGVQTDSSNSTSIYINKTGTGNILDFQSGGNSAFAITNAGDINFGANANHTISVAAAGAGVAGKTLTITAGGAGTGSAVNGGDLLLQGGAPSGTGTAGNVIVRSNASDGVNTFRVQNAAATTTVLNVDTLNTRVGIGGTATLSKFEVIGGNAAVYNNGSDPKIFLGDSTSAGQNGFLMWDSTNDYLRFETDGTNGLKLNGNNVAIGNIFPSQPLIVGSGSTNLFQINTTGDITLGNNADKTMAIAQAASGAGRSLTIQAGQSNTGAVDGGNLLLQGGATGGTGKTGSVIVRANSTNSPSAFAVQAASTSNVFVVDTTNSRAGINLGGSVTPTLSNAGLQINQGAIRLSGAGGFDSYTSPQGGNFNAKINIANDDPGNFGQLIAAGISVGSDTRSRALSLFDARNVAHQQTLAVFSPDENSTIGFNWNGISTSATIGSLNKTTSGGTTTQIVLQSGDVAGGNGSSGDVRVNSGSIAGGTGGSTGAVYLQSGDGTGTNSSSGGVTIDTGTVTGTGTAGSILIGTGTANSAKTISLGPTSTKTSATTIQIGVNTSGTETIQIGSTSTGNAAAGTTVNIQGGTGGSAVVIGSNGAGAIAIDSGTTGNVNIGTGSNAKQVTLGSTTSTSKTILQAGSNNLVINVSGTDRATFDNANSVYFGNGVTANAPNDFTLRATGSSTTGVRGGILALQGGNATVGNANGGNVTLTGGSGFGTGVSGLVVISTPTFQTTANDANCYTSGTLVASSCTITANSVNNSSAIIVGFSTAGQTATLPDPTTTTAGRVVYVTAANSSNDFTLSVNGGGTGNQIAMRQNTTATMIWNGADWTAAGASSSTTLQSAYDNTLQSAGGAELIVSKTSATNGLTIRDSTVNPVNGTLLSVQTQSAAGLFSVNSSVTEYSSNGGAETAGASSSTFPASTWAAVGSTTVSRYTTAGNFIATGQASVSAATTTAANDGVKDTLATTLTANNHYNVSFTARLSSGTFTDMNVYYSIDGTAASVACTTGQAIKTSVWTKINCAFTAPSSGITSSNAILIRQTGSGTARTFYVDNLSVTIAADYNYATDGSVDDSVNFATNWSAVASSTVTRSTTVGNDASDSAQVVTTTSNQGVRNKLSINPLTSTLYRITAYSAATTSGFNTFTVRYSRDGGTNFVACADYNTQAISSSTTSFTKVTCYITTDNTAPTNPYVYFTQTDVTGRTWYVDTFSMTLSTNTAPNVQVGGGINGGPVTLLTVDRGASAPIASDNDALLGSIYYDTTLGKLQCYEADGWGACGSSPDNIITISPEYTNAVMHGTGVGTMTSDICSDALNINDGSSSQPTICGTNETYNFYKWTSPQPSSQPYSIYVTYQLPSTFKSFSSGQTSLMGRTDSSNSSVTYQVYRNNTASGLTACGSTVSVSSGSVSSWQTGIATGAADPSTCGFAGGDSIVFKINVAASSNANAYVGNLNFTFSNR